MGNFHSLEIVGRGGLKRKKMSLEGVKALMSTIVACIMCLIIISALLLVYLCNQF